MPYLVPAQGVAIDAYVAYVVPVAISKEVVKRGIAAITMGERVETLDKRPVQVFDICALNEVHRPDRCIAGTAAQAQVGRRYQV